MKRVEVHFYSTPLRGNEDCPHSLGIMNLTKAEADMIATYANGIRSTNSPRAQGMTATDMRAMTGGPNYGRVDVLDWRNDREAAEYVEQMQRARRNTEAERVRRAEALQAAYATELALPLGDRTKYLTGDWGQDDKPVKPEPAEPIKPRNRFSGLDIE